MIDFDCESRQRVKGRMELLIGDSGPSLRNEEGVVYFERPDDRHDRRLAFESGSDCVDILVPLLR